MRSPASRSRPSARSPSTPTTSAKPFAATCPPERFEFVELVERGRPDWLASACRKKVQCDVLLISGHFDDGSEFYSDRLDSHDHLPVAEMERASCTDGCSGLFSRLKEVYLFGCNTLNADPLRYASGEAVRSLVRAGHSPADAEALARVLEARHGESNRDRMRVVFKDAPVIYGFSSKAPLGARAGPLLERYFKAGGGAEVGQGRSSAALLSLFGQVSMRSAPGVTVTDVHAGHREDVCRFVDDAPAPVERVRFVHALMKRDMAEVQLHSTASTRSPRRSRGRPRSVKVPTRWRRSRATATRVRAISPSRATQTASRRRGGCCALRAESAG